MDGFGTSGLDGERGAEEPPPFAWTRRLATPRPRPAGGLPARAMRLVDALRRHHAPTADHSLRVATILLAAWRLDPDRRLDAETVAAAGLLHDAGKLNLPLAILDGQRPLEAAERQEVARHPQAGASLLRALGFPGAVCDAALTHHERWDGAGYPLGLAGTEIPWIGRLTAVADSFVAMIEPGRRYRAPRRAKEALEEIARCSGRQFDPEAVRLLRAALGDPCAVRDAPRPEDGEGEALAAVLAGIPRAIWA
ncbi:HD-GYP domain-containing protein [Rubritepida flocculans]|uniref:HD-GYP domain-containing protein n=1 Tax=Rubritepida flocculans TaxID=182403 RepID=UPI000428D81D|nr:HD domain-containing phosphohydrolase [Rubritepida flocculans]